MPGTSCHHRGNRHIAVRARQRQWHEAAGEEHPPPREIGRHQPLGRPPAAMEEIPQFVAMGAADDPHGPLRVPHQPAEGEREAGGEGEDGDAPVVALHGADWAPTLWQISNGG